MEGIISRQMMSHVASLIHFGLEFVWRVQGSFGQLKTSMDIR